MRIADRLLIKTVAKTTALIIVLFFMGRLSPALPASIVVMLGLWAALARRSGMALSCYVLMPLLMVANPILCPQSGISSVILRLGFLGMTVVLVIAAGKRAGRERVPLGALWLYVVVAIVSSTGGYAPLISYLKLVSFACFLVGIWLGLQNLDRDPAALMQLRVFLLSVASIVILGSIATLPFPAIAYFTSVKAVISSAGYDAAGDYVSKMQGLRLFTGVTNHSQCMSTLAVMSVAWVLCDMLFVENRLSISHIVLLICGVPILYMTRSRGALLSACVGVAMIYVYCLKFLMVSRRLKTLLRNGMTLFVFIVAVAAVAMEIRSHSMSKWLRKTDDVDTDRRSAVEAFTASRMGLVEANLYDYRRNPLLGSGFQVSYEFQYRYGSSALVFSAPIEKGVLPLMILGETGILGAFAFLVFLISFYITSTQRRYTVTATLFTILLANNMGEATFFSTGGAGGIIWIMSIVGGFCIDMIVLHRRRMESFIRQQEMMAFNR